MTRQLINNIKSLTFLLLLVSLFINCKTKNKDNNSDGEASSLSNQTVLSQVIDSVNQEITNGEYGLIDRFMVIKNEDVLADFKYTYDYESIAKKYDTTNHQYNYNHPKWHPYYQQSELHTLQSVTKSVTSIIMGIALNMNRNYDVNTEIMAFFSDYTIENKDKRLFDITIEDLLTMRSGFKWNEGEYSDLTDDCIAMEASDDWIQFVLNKPFDSNPGEKWEYNSGVSVLIGKVIREITGKRIDEFAEETLFKPLGINEYYWKITPKGEVDTEGGLYLKAEDLAKLGTLFLNGGTWKNRQIVPRSWVEASISPKVTNVWPKENVDVGYGYQWWTEDYNNGQNVFSANGYGGQYLMVVPDKKLFVVFNGWNINKKPEKSTFNVLVKRLLPALKEN
ncbi:serine hydrolase domain-containing protein [Aestuariivivens sediminis]|uniref:serine hydrolase domain-containing protein n=1 Tax=Aestuariivivens sediminis TaxID=2913557 RepID=UPI001F57C829|nr:serine hydrolase [Aestuariivivens sediminis]